MPNKKQTKQEEGKSRIDEVRELAAKHSDLFFIVSHPMTDEIFMSFNGQESLFRFPSNADYFQNNVVFQILSAPTFKDSIDHYLTALQESLKLKANGNEILEGGQFLGLVDGFLYNVSGAREVDEDYAAHAAKKKKTKASSKNVEKSKPKKKK